MLRTLWIVVLTVIAWAIAMGIQAAGFDKSRNTGLITRFDSPVAMLELARLQEFFASVIDQGDRKNNVGVMQTNTYMDFFFIVLYCSTLILLGIVTRVQPALRNILLVTVLGAAVFDYWENLRMLRLLKILAANAMTHSPLSRPVSLVKWALFAVDLDHRRLCLVV